MSEGNMLLLDSATSSCNGGILSFFFGCKPPGLLRMRDLSRPTSTALVVCSCVAIMYISVAFLFPRVRLYNISPPPAEDVTTSSAKKQQRRRPWWLFTSKTTHDHVWATGVGLLFSGGASTAPAGVSPSVVRSADDDREARARGVGGGPATATASAPSYCNACEKVIVGAGLVCLICGRCAHQSHVHEVNEQPCKRICSMGTPVLPAGVVVRQTPGKAGGLRERKSSSQNLNRKSSSTSIASSSASSSSLTSYVSMPQQDHQWIEGNLRTNSTCIACGTTCGDSPGLSDLRCAWCHQCIHTTCQTTLPPTPCPLSLIPDITVPTCLLKPKAPLKSPTEPRYDLLPLYPDSSLRPLLCFVNPRAGSQADAPALLVALYSLLNPLQVVDTSKENPERILRTFVSILDRCRIIVCGGDGTVGWILSLVDKVLLEANGEAGRSAGGSPWASSGSLPSGGINTPPVAIIPMGTGNDLARVLGWSGGWASGGEDVVQIVRDVVNAEEVDLDRWTVEVEPWNVNENFAESATSPKSPGFMEAALRLAAGSKDGGKKRGATKQSDVKKLLMYNYLSIGADAGIVLDFHNARESKPHFFRSRFINKVWYAVFGGKHVVTHFAAVVSNVLWPRSTSPPLSPKPLARKLAPPKISTNITQSKPAPLSPTHHAPLEGCILRIVERRATQTRSGAGIGRWGHGWLDDKSDDRSEGETHPDAGEDGEFVNGFHSHDDEIDGWTSGGTSGPPTPSIPQQPQQQPVVDIPLSSYGGVILLNIPSYGGGARIFRHAETTRGGRHPPCEYDDAALEVLGVLNPLHVGASLVGISSPRVVGRACGRGEDEDSAGGSGSGEDLRRRSGVPSRRESVGTKAEYMATTMTSTVPSQGTPPAVEIRIPGDSIAMQVDGEPWLQKGPCVVRVSLYGKAKMLKRKSTRSWWSALAGAVVWDGLVGTYNDEGR